MKPATAEHVPGLDRAIAIARRRLEHYRAMTGPAMRAHPATIAIIEELLIFLEAERERAASAP